VNWKAVRFDDGLFVSVEDITKRKRAEQELKDEQYFLEQVTDNTPHLIYVYDLAEGSFVYINKRIQQLTAIDQEYVYGMGPHLFKKLLHPDDLARRMNYFGALKTLRRGEIRENEFRLQVGDRYRWFRSKDHIFKEEGGAIRQVIGLGEDITYEKLLQEKVERSDDGALN
jgi:PAS domain S-box-containing protein